MLSKHPIPDQNIFNLRTMCKNKYTSRTKQNVFIYGLINDIDIDKIIINQNPTNIEIDTDCSNTDCEKQRITNLSVDFTKFKLEDVSECKIISKVSDDSTSISKKFIIAIDNDECIGSWGDMSMLYSMLKIEFKKEPSIEMFTDIMVKTGSVRPYVKDLFEKLLELKKCGIVYKIFMFTASSNDNGWVFYLSKILENWIGQKFYDGIFIFM